MSIDIGQVEEADDIIASLNALLMEEKQRRADTEQALAETRKMLHGAEHSLAVQLKRRREVEDQLHASTREAWALHDKLMEARGNREQLRRRIAELQDQLHEANNRSAGNVGFWGKV